MQAVRPWVWSRCGGAHSLPLSCMLGFEPNWWQGVGDHLCWMAWRTLFGACSAGHPVPGNPGRAGWLETPLHFQRAASASKSNHRPTARCRPSRPWGSATQGTLRPCDVIGSNERNLNKFELVRLDGTSRNKAERLSLVTSILSMTSIRSDATPACAWHGSARCFHPPHAGRTLPLPSPTDSYGLTKCSKLSSDSSMRSLRNARAHDPRRAGRVWVITSTVIVAREIGMQVAITLPSEMRDQGRRGFFSAMGWETPPQVSGFGAPFK